MVPLRRQISRSRGNRVWPRAWVPNSADTLWLMPSSTSPMANMPIRTTTKLMPFSRISKPKVSLGTEYRGSRPMEATTRPANRDSMLGNTSPLAIAITDTNPRKVAAEELRLIEGESELAKGGEKNVISNALTIPPIAEQVTAMPSALADSPRRVIG